MAYSFAVTVASRGFHVYQNNSWTNVSKVINHANSLTYRPTAIPSGGLEILLQLTFTGDDKSTLDFVNGFVKSLYDWNYTGLVQDNNDQDDDEEESDSDADFVVNTKDNEKKMIMQMMM